MRQAVFVVALIALAVLLVVLLGEPAPDPRDDQGRLNPDLPRWMMGYPAGWLDELPRTAALRCAGNGCQPQVAALAVQLLLPEHAAEAAA